MTIYCKPAKTQRFCRPLHEAVGGKPAKTEADVDAAAKERPEEAPFAALRPHGFRLRTWNRTPAAKPTCPDNKYKYLSIIDCKKVQEETPIMQEVHF